MNLVQGRRVTPGFYLASYLKGRMVEAERRTGLSSSVPSIKEIKKINKTMSLFSIHEILEKWFP